MGPQDTPYESGIYKAKLLFPPEFPSQPPEMIFQTEMWHPNGAVATPAPRGTPGSGRPTQREREREARARDPRRAGLRDASLSALASATVHEDGKVCISILHPPGEDAFNEQESAEERWRPILGVEQILMSVISLLSAPNADSPANIDAAVMFRENPKEWKKRVRKCAEKSVDCM